MRGADAAFAAARRIWDSAATPQARAYRERLGLAGDGGMAVVVMPLIEARVSGIAFTRDPVGGRHDEMLIHANWGLGEALVSGRPRATSTGCGRTRRRCRGAGRQPDRRQAPASRPLADGQGTGLRPTRDDEARAATLTPAQAEALGAIARDAARALDYSAQGHDLEWAWDGQRFWILQARPITAAARHAYDGLRGQPSYWSRGNTREVLPYAVSALEWEALRVMCLRVLNRGFELAGYRPGPAWRWPGCSMAGSTWTRPRSSGWPTTRSASRPRSPTACWADRSRPSPRRPSAARASGCTAGAS